MVKGSLTGVERSVMKESNWTPVGDLASSILRAAAEKREQVNMMKAAVARDHAGGLQMASGGIWVQLDLPLVMAPRRPQHSMRAGQMSQQ